jgi:hypothetical protein
MAREPPERRITMREDDQRDWASYAQRDDEGNIENFEQVMDRVVFEANVLPDGEEEETTEVMEKIDWGRHFGKPARVHGQKMALARRRVIITRRFRYSQYS